jgi:ComF family protein
MSRERFAVLQEWVIAGKEILFPFSCLGCSVSMPVAGEALCEECLQSVALIGSPKCPACGYELRDSASGDHFCGSCLRDKPPFTTACAVAHYQEPVSTFLQSLKYGGDLSVLPALQAIVDLGPSVMLTEEDRIIPVPLHVQRLRYRGFNQAVLIAKLFFPDKKNLILVDTLQRIRHTDPQTGLDGTARRKNLRDAFTVRDKDKVRGRRIIVIDDVFTTGTTVSECSHALLAAGAKDVQVLTLARVRG